MSIITTTPKVEKVLVEKEARVIMDLSLDEAAVILAFLGAGCAGGAGHGLYENLYSHVPTDKRKTVYNMRGMVGASLLLGVKNK